MSLIKKFFATIWNFFWMEKVPLWVTLMLTVGGGYFIAPFINKEIQRESLRRDFLVGSLEGLSTDTVLLITDVNKYLLSPENLEIKTLISEKSVQLQYKLVQLNISLPEKVTDGIEVQNALVSLSEDISLNKPLDVVRTSLANFSQKSFGLYQEIVVETGLI